MQEQLSGSGTTSDCAEVVQDTTPKVLDAYHLAMSMTAFPLILQITLLLL